MKIRIVAGCFSLGLVAAIGLGLAASPQTVREHPQNPAASSSDGVKFAVDSVHSSVVFKVAHMGVANFYGRFNGLEGAYTLNEADPAKSQFEFTVKTDKVDTGNSKRDGHLKSPDFFNSAEYPTITFKSTKVERKGDKNVSVTGEMTMHGVTKPVIVDIAITTAKQTPQGYKGGLETTFTIKRTDFDMDTYVANGGLGDEVTLTVAVEGAREP